VLRLRVPNHLAETIRTLHPNIKRKVRAALDNILENPHSGKALKEELEGLRSFRVGRLRIIYRIPKGKDAIEVIAIGPRRIIYEETLHLVIKDKE
jgi:mRNA interferase RelE/StbE